jgi:hypothetical protein
MRTLAEKADEEAKGEMVEAKEGKTIQVGEKVTEGV